MRYEVADSEVEFSAIRAQGPGGQHVNKTSSAVQLRFDIASSRLPEPVKTRLLAIAGHRLSAKGIIVIKAQGTRSLQDNKAEALARLQALVDQACRIPKIRKPTKPTHGSKLRRLAGKAERSEVKAGRGKVPV